MPAAHFPAPAVLRRRDRRRADGDARGAEGSRIREVICAEPVGRSRHCAVIQERPRAATSAGCRCAACTPRVAQLRRG
jgi:hypothetical protein